MLSAAVAPAELEVADPPVRAGDVGRDAAGGGATGLWCGGRIEGATCVRGGALIGAGGAADGVLVAFGGCCGGALLGGRLEVRSQCC
jgi:hypothetical protein